MGGVDYTGFAHPKGTSKVLERKATQAALGRAQQKVISAVWKRDRFHCRCCAKPVKRDGVESLQAGHVHHLVYRSRGGGWETSNMYLTCPIDHAAIHAGQLTVTAKTKRGADGPLQVVRRKA